MHRLSQKAPKLVLGLFKSNRQSTYSGKFEISYKISSLSTNNHFRNDAMMQGNVTP